MAVDSDSAAGLNTQLLFLLKAFHTTFVEETHPRSVSDKLFQRIAGRVLEQSREVLLSLSGEKDSSRSLDLLLDLINVFGENLFTVADQAEVGVLHFGDTSLFKNISFIRCWMGSFWTTLARY
jgi:hypothetical protein